MIITIDGPVASGKTTIGKLLASKLMFDYLYSGFLYRAIAYALFEYTDYTIDTFVSLSIESIDNIVQQVSLEYCFMPNGNCQIIMQNNILKETLLMTPLIDRAASMLGLNNNVRNLLNAVQKKLVLGRNVIVDGRDAGSIVFPNAEYKFFLTASLQVRVERYIKRQENIGATCTYAQAEQIIIDRDTRDGRWLTKLTGVNDSIPIDTSFMEKEEVVDKIIQYIQYKK